MSTTRTDFWSRRRAMVAAEQAAEAQATQDEIRAEQEAQLEARSDEDILAELNLPAPEEMDSAEQVKTLLRAMAPQRLKSRAMRRLWRLNPVLANLDGLVDYDDDYTDAAVVVENLQTIYQVGKGMFDKALEAEAEAALKAAAVSEAEEPADDVPEAEQTDTSAIVAETPEAPADPETQTAAEPAPPETPSAPRRMRFRFEAAT